MQSFIPIFKHTRLLSSTLKKKANKSSIAGSDGRKFETSEVKEKVIKITPSFATASGN